MTSRERLLARVRELLHRRAALAVLSEREATLSLSPHGCGVHALPADRPLNHARPTAANPVGARGEREFDRGDFRG